MAIDYKKTRELVGEKNETVGGREIKEENETMPDKKCTWSKNGNHTTLAKK